MNHMPPASIERELLARLLAARAFACPRCRYNLQNCESDRCPECGSILQLGLVTPGSRHMWWMASVIGLSLTSALAAYLLIASSGNVVAGLMNTKRDELARAGFVAASEMPNWPMMFALVAMLLGAALALASVLPLRRRFLLLSRPRQLLIGLGGLASPMLLLAAIAALVRLL